MADIAKYERMLERAKAAGDAPAVEYFQQKISGLRSGAVTPEADEGGPGMVSGLGAQAVAGINRGVIGTLALPDTLGDLVTSGLSWAGAIDPETAERINRRTPGYEEMLKSWEGFAGELPKPRNAGEKFVSDVAEFVPGLGAGGGIRQGLKMTAGNIGAGVASNAAGAALEGTPLEAPARVIGAIAGQRAVSPVTIGKSELARQVGDADKARKTVSKAADKRWNEVRRQDASYDPGTIRKFLTDLKRDRAELLNPSFNPQGAKVAKELRKAGDRVNKLEMPKRASRDEAMRPAPVEGAGPELKNMRAFNQKLREVMEQAPVTTRSGMSSADFKKLEGGAREMSQRKILDTIIRDFEPAEGAYLSGVESGLRNRAGSYLKRQGGALDPILRDAIADITKREGIIGEGIIGTLGNRLGGHMLSGIGAGTHGILGFLLGQGAHLGARKLGEKTALNAKEKARRVALAGRSAQKKARKMDELWKRRRNLNTGIAGDRALQQTDRESLY